MLQGWTEDNSDSISSNTQRDGQSGGDTRKSASANCSDVYVTRGGSLEAVAGADRDWRDILRARVRQRHEPGKMNQLETRYSGYLGERKAVGEILAWRFEALKLRLADKTFYSPDFMVQNIEGEIELHETKGFWEEDARIKIKVAAEMFPEFHFVGIQWDKRSGWKFENFN